MIVQHIDSYTQVIYTDNRISDVKKIASELGYLKKDGDYYKTVELIQNVSYYPIGASNSIDATKFIYKGVTTYIVNKMYSFSVNKTNVASVIQNLNQFSSKYVMKCGLLNFNGCFSIDSYNNILSSDGISISISDDNKPNNTNIDNFIHRMSMDNGRMLYPVIKRFINTAFMFNGHKSMLTGYIKLRDYLYMIKTPSTGLFNTKNNQTAKYYMKLNSGNARMTVVDVTDGIPTIELNIDGSIISNDLNGKFDPFLLFTTKPISLKNQKIPFKTVQYKGVTIFITPLLFSNIETLRMIKGGINLLS